MTDIRKLPIGIQDFEDLRTNGYLYVDKTEYIYQLVNFGKPYFLGRPRRFGKSLFLSTLKAYFLGKKELFDGLAIAELEKDWIEYPVIYMDFNVGIYTGVNLLYQTLNYNLQIFEEKWGKAPDESNPATRFAWLIRKAYEQTKRKVVVLIDEYDKPLIDTLDNPDINDEIRRTLKGFYGILKSSDAYLRFVFLTGVTKFSKVSVFSDLNHLVDISMDDEYSGICGITQNELEQYFEPEIQILAKKRKMTCEETLAALKKHYDGYRFAIISEDIYNPYSLLNTFSKGYFKNYWFETGTPTFLAKMVQRASFINIKSMESEIRVSVDFINSYRASMNDPFPILYQSGYLTIKGYDKDYDQYVLGFPNEEVEYGFLNELMGLYMQEAGAYGSEFDSPNFVRDLNSNNVEGFMTRLRAFFASMSNRLKNKDEKDFQTVFYLLFKLMGQFVETEYDSAIGRADAVVFAKTNIYVFEFKMTGNGTAEDAMRQINERKYALPFTASGKNLVKVGVEFSVDKDERNIVRWTVG